MSQQLDEVVKTCKSLNRVLEVLDFDALTDTEFDSLMECLDRTVSDIEEIQSSFEEEEEEEGAGNEQV